MKLSNIFKKNTKKETTSNVEKLEKNQLEKVIGGLDTPEPSYNQQVNKSKSNVRNN